MKANKRKRSGGRARAIQTQGSRWAVGKHRSSLITPHLKATWFKRWQRKPAKYSGNPGHKAQSCLSTCFIFFYSSNVRILNFTETEWLILDLNKTMINLMCKLSCKRNTGLQVWKGSNASGVVERGQRETAVRLNITPAELGQNWGLNKHAEAKTRRLWHFPFHGFADSLRFWTRF